MASGGDKGEWGPMLRIREMRDADVPFALELCRQAGWNQTAADWRHLLVLEPHGVFVAEADGRPRGTASTVCYGRRTAWIGMVLVDPGHRRRGIGSALMFHCIDVLKADRAESIKLDATDAGREVYLKLGFRDERPVHRYAGVVPPDQSAVGGLARAISEADWAGIAALDALAFGADRLRLLRLLAADGEAVVVGERGAVEGYGYSRAGHEAAFVGPVVALGAEAAGAVVHALIARLPAGKVYWDVLPDNAAAAPLAESLHLTVSRRLTRMVLGATMHSGEVSRVVATAGFELG